VEEHIDQDGEIQVTGDAAAGTVTLAVNLPGVEQGKFTLSMEASAAEKLAMGLAVMANKVKQARLELAEEVRRKAKLN
jgi:hypothetical protein